jgi:hypothetical protein
MAYALNLIIFAYHHEYGRADFSSSLSPNLWHLTKSELNWVAAYLRCVDKTQFVILNINYERHQNTHC